jgi:SdpI/YfhL protein family
VPLSIRLVLGAVELLFGIGLLAVAVLGARGRLRRNRLAGVRTPASLRSDEAFGLANRVASVPIGAGGAVGIAAGGALVGGAGGALGWLVFGIGLVGTVVLAGIGGAAGDRAAAALPEPVRPGCAGECAGCELVASCRPAEDPAQS